MLVQQSQNKWEEDKNVNDIMGNQLLRSDQSLVA